MRAALLCTACSLSLLQLNLGRRQGNFTTEAPCDGVAATALSCSAEVRGWDTQGKIKSLDGKKSKKLNQLEIRLVLGCIEAKF